MDDHVQVWPGLAYCLFSAVSRVHSVSSSIGIHGISVQCAMISVVEIGGGLHKSNEDAHGCCAMTSVP